MKLRVFAAAFGALLLAGLSACVSTPTISANPPNVLDAYVAKPDPSFAWKVEKTFTGAGYHGAVLELTSQTWMSAAQSDRPVWKHWLTVTIPDAVSSDKAFLYIGGGSTTSAAPVGPSERFALMAVDTKFYRLEL